MNRPAILLLLIAGPWLSIQCSTKPKPAGVVKDTWDNVKTSVSSLFERSGSMFFLRELDIPEKSRITIKNVTGTVAIARLKNPKVASNGLTKVFIEAEKRGKQSLLQLTQIDVKTNDLTTTITTKITEADKGIPVYYTLTVPDTVTVVVEQQDGDIMVRDVGCPLSLQINNTGSMTIENVKNSVTARALKGSITLTQAQLPEHASIFLEAYNNIYLTLPKNIRAQLNAKTTEGIVTSKLPVTLEPITTMVTGKAWKNLRRNIRGDLGSGGGPSIVLDATTGNINISALDATE